MERLLALLSACVIAALFAATAGADVNIKYADPNGGWTYSYQDGVIFDPNDGPRTFVHLDGTWDSFNGLEAWDGSAVGEVGPKPDGDSPGGVSGLVDPDDTAYVRVQDTGNPKEYGWEHNPGSNTNHKFNFVHDISGYDPGDDPNDPNFTGGVYNLSILDDGVTLSFRARIATTAATPSHPLDDEYPDVLFPSGPDPWPAGGIGSSIGFYGHGSFGIHQSTGGQIGFSLVNQATWERLAVPNPPVEQPSGLIMNRQAGGELAESDVDTKWYLTDNNVFPVSDEDLTAWREFWITIDAADDNSTATHDVNVYMDGNLTPTTFHVTAGADIASMSNYHSGGILNSLSYLTMGCAGTWFVSGAVDIDFFSYKEGVIVPEAGLVRGDVNGDGEVNHLDVDPFIELLLNGPFADAADMNEDGRLDGRDVQAFVTAVQAGGGAAAVPEPSTLALAAMLGMLALGLRRRR